MRSGPLLPLIGMMILIVITPGAGAAELTGTRLITTWHAGTPVNELTTTVLFKPGEKPVQLEVRAYLIPKKADEALVPIKARGAQHRDPDGLFRLSATVRPGREPRERVEIPIDPLELDLPVGDWEIGFMVRGPGGEGEEFVAAVPAVRLEVTEGATRSARIVHEYHGPTIVSNPPPVVRQDQGTMPPPTASGKLPVPVAPSKVLPTAPVPSKTLPVPMALALIPRRSEGFFLGAPRRMTPDESIQAELRSQPHVSLSKAEPDRAKRLVYFATNRDPIAATEGQRLNSRFANTQSRDDKLTFGSCLVNIPIWIDGRRRLPGSLPLAGLNLFGIDENVFKVEPFAQSDWDDVRAALRRVRRGKADELLVFVHGFNNTPEDATLRLAQLAYDTGFLGRAILFSWPSAGSLLVTWSGGSSPKVAYLQDAQMASKSDGALKDLLGRLIRLQAEKVPAGQAPPKIHIVAHSMGNRVLLRAMQRIKEDADLRDRKAIGHLVLAAPDVDPIDFAEATDTFQLAEDVTLYFNNRDRALEVSHEVNRVGRVGAVGYFVPKIPIENVDARFANTSVLGHDYAMSGDRLLRDLNLLLFDNLRASKRPTLRDTRAPDQYLYWVFPPVTFP
jgi:esterase/lipase superfamily enzyme